MQETSAIQAALQPVLAATSQSARVPGFILAYARRDGPAQHLVHGEDGLGQPLAEDSLIPIASITKLATALVVLRLVDQQALRLDDPLAVHLPDAAAASAGPTLRDLLCHVGGLPLNLAPEAAPYDESLTWEKIARACLAEPVERPPRTRVQYSNVDYTLLTLAIERVTGEPFGALLERLVLSPLGVEAYLGSEPPRRPARLTDVRGPQVGTPLEVFNSRFWQALGLPYGGLVSTAGGALKLVRAYLGQPPDFLRSATRTEAIRNQTDTLGGGQFEPLIWDPCPWGLGPELRGRKRPHWAPTNASPLSFGHAGASGCLAWADPRADVAWVLLGTRVAQSGWLLRGGAAIGAALLDALAGRPVGV
jgi:beta-lactamase class C